MDHAMDHASGGRMLVVGAKVSDDIVARISRVLDHSRGETVSAFVRQAVEAALQERESVAVAERHERERQERLADVAGLIA